MKRLLTTYLTLCALLLAAWQCLAQVNLPLLGVGGKASGGGAYVGPGDIVSGAWAWHGLMAYSAAKAGTKAVNACNSTGGTDVGCGDLSTDPTTGKLVSATISGITCPGANCTAKTLYDQTGSTNCNSASIACDLTQATVATRPTLVASCIGSLPCLQCSGSQAMYTTNFLGGGGPTGNPPYSVAVISNRTGAVTSYTGIVSSSSGGGQMNAFNVANTVDWVATGGGDVTATASDSTTHALIGTNSSTSGGTSVLYVDGSSASASVNGFSVAGTWQLCDGGFGKFTGNVFEDGVWGVAFTGTQAANMNSNMHSRWGF